MELQPIQPCGGESKYADPDGGAAAALPWLSRAAWTAGRQAAAPVASAAGQALQNAIQNSIATAWTAVTLEHIQGASEGAIWSKPEPGTKGSDEGVINEVDGSKTSSGLPYVGSTNDKNQRKDEKSDGRDRKDAKVVDTYDKDNRAARQQKEQQVREPK